MTTRQKVRTLADRYEADFIVNQDPPALDCEVIAPRGWHWLTDGLHAFVGNQWRRENVREVYADMLDRMSDGIEKCTPDTCQLWDAEAGKCGHWA